jgi:hypothetical protein
VIIIDAKRQDSPLKVLVFALPFQVLAKKGNVADLMNSNAQNFEICRRLV